MLRDLPSPPPPPIPFTKQFILSAVKRYSTGKCATTATITITTPITTIITTTEVIIIVFNAL